MESGTPGLKSTADGWLNRALADEKLTGKPSAFRAVALGTQVPRTLQGKLPAIAISNLQDFSVGGRGPNTSPISNAFQAMYDESTDSDAAWHRAGDVRSGEDVEVGRSGALPAGRWRQLSECAVRQQPEAGRSVDEVEPRRRGCVF